MTLDPKQILAIQNDGIDWTGASLVADGKWGPKTAWWSGILGLPHMRQQIVRTALRYHAMGVKETSPNRGTWIDKFLEPAGLVGQPWCAAFASYCLREAGADWPVYHVSAWALIQWAKANGRLTDDPLPGDIATFLHAESNFQPVFTPGHVTVVTGRDANWVSTCEGNSHNAVSIGRRGRPGLVFVRTVLDVAAEITMPSGLAVLDGSGTR